VATRTLPGSVMIGNDSRHPGAGFFEAKFAPLMINYPESGISNVRPNSWFTEDRMLDRLQAAKALDKPFARYLQRQERARLQRHV